MKRSEMLKILQESFIYHMNPTGPAETDEEMYSNILGDLEQAGMLSPGWYINSRYYNTASEHSWEPENEKK